MLRKSYFRSFNNAVFRRIAGGAQRPVFFDVAETVPSLLSLEHNVDVIRAELLPLLEQRDDMPRYHDIDPNQTYISDSTPQRWSIFMLSFLGEDFPDNRACCPNTCALLDRIPNLFQCFVSILEAGKSVPAHGGPYLGYLRYHLGISIPGHNPPRLRVKDQEHVWQEGVGVLFDDSWNHEVYNESSGDRMVLIVDVLRPLPWYAHLLNKCFVRTVGAGYARRITNIANRFKGR